MRSLVVTKPERLNPGATAISMLKAIRARHRRLVERLAARLKAARWTAEQLELDARGLCRPCDQGLTFAFRCGVRGPVAFLIRGSAAPSGAHGPACTCVERIAYDSSPQLGLSSSMPGLSTSAFVSWCRQLNPCCFCIRCAFR